MCNSEEKKEHIINSFKEEDTSEKLEVENLPENKSEDNDSNYETLKHKKNNFFIKVKEENKNARFVKMISSITNYIILICIAVVINIIIDTYILDDFYVSGTSMDNTLHDGQKILVYKYRYKPKRGDVAIIDATLQLGAVTNKDSGQQAPHYIVKRIIGIPGDQVHADGDQVYLNGEKLDEPYIQEKKDEYNAGNYKYFTEDFDLGDVCEVSGLPNDCEYIPDGYYLVLGDNRAVSLDSPEIGLIKAEQFHSRAILILKPKSDFKWLFQQVRYIHLPFNRQFYL